jgi:hypothetical protein
MQDGLWIAPPAKVRRLNFLGHAQDLPGFPDIELELRVVTLVCQLGETYLLRRETVIQVEEFQGRHGELLEVRWEDCGLEVW